MRTTDSIALVAIAGGLWVNVLISSPVHRALAWDVDGEARGFAVAGVQSADGNPVVWRLEKKTGKIQFCVLQPPEKLHPKPAGPKPGTPEYDAKYPPGSPEHDAPQGIAEPPARDHAPGTAKDVDFSEFAFAGTPALRVACLGSGP